MTTYTGTSGPDSLSGGTGNDNLYGLASGDTLSGSDGNDNLYGGTGSDTLYGGAGNDQLDGGAGADVMYGGIGNDTYVVREAGDVVVELSGEGIDTVKSFITYALGANLEVLSLQGTANISGAGNELNNTLQGNSGNNFLDGRAGNDSINGGDGDDTIVGGLGNDILYGGNGVDTLAYTDASASVTVSLALVAVNQNTGAAGTDKVSGFENLTGSDYNDTLTGDAGDNRIVGGTGADTMSGGAGDDFYSVDNVGDVVIENPANAGVDLVVSTVSFTLGAGIENLSLAGSAAINGTGNNLDNKIAGNGASNVLNGKGGHDDIAGGAASDTFVFDAPDASSSDTIRGFVSGFDIVQVSASGFGLSIGSLAADQFVTGEAATEAHGQFIFNALHQLLWDADGTGGGSAVLVADFFGSTVSITDIVVGP